MLANERTLLAYLRSSLSFVAFGFVVARCALFTREFGGAAHLAGTSQHFSTAFGTAVALFGVVIAVFGGYRYVAADHAIATNADGALSPVVAAGGAALVAVVGALVGVFLTTVR